MAIDAIRKGAKEENMTFMNYVLRGSDPSVNVVLLEDMAAVMGVGIAIGCMGLTSYTGSHIPDALGSCIIGSLLAGVSGFIVFTNSTALVGRSIPQQDIQIINNEIESDVMIRAIHDVKGHNVMNKLVEKYHGPYKIVKTYENGVMYDIQHKYRNTILLRIHHKHLKKWHETPEELKEVNPERNLEDTKSETSENDFEGFTKENQSMFRVNWEKSFRRDQRYNKRRQPFSDRQLSFRNRPYIRNVDITQAGPSGIRNERNIGRDDLRNKIQNRQNQLNYGNNKHPNQGMKWKKVSINVTTTDIPINRIKIEVLLPSIEINNIRKCFCLQLRTVDIKKCFCLQLRTVDIKSIDLRTYNNEITSLNLI
ncbi:hypothetical protein Anas_11456, partial [Armadillidium nasatum]